MKPESGTLPSRNVNEFHKKGCQEKKFCCDRNRGLFLEIKEIVPDVDIRTLDQRHVIPNMEVPVVRGVWFPRGF